MGYVLLHFVLPRLVFDLSFFFLSAVTHSTLRLGLIMKRAGDISAAREVLVESVTQWGFNWSAWIELGSVLSDWPAVTALTLPTNHIMTELFLAHMLLETHQNQLAITRFTQLETTFRNSAFLKAQGVFFFNLFVCLFVFCWFVRLVLLLLLLLLLALG